MPCATERRHSPGCSGATGAPAPAHPLPSAPLQDAPTLAPLPHVFCLLLLYKIFQLQDFPSFFFPFVLFPVLQRLLLLKFIFPLKKKEKPSNHAARVGKDRKM